MAGGRWQVASGMWHVACGRLQVAGGRWQAADGRTKVAGSGGRWWVVGVTWQHCSQALFYCQALFIKR